MASTTASVGEPDISGRGNDVSRAKIHSAIDRLTQWLEKNDYRGYDTFDGLNAKYLRPMTFENGLLRTVLQQGVRRFPLNLRPLLGISMEHSSKGMGFLARGFMRLHKEKGEEIWADRAKKVLDWLIKHQQLATTVCPGVIISIISHGLFIYPRAHLRSCGRL